MAWWWMMDDGGGLTVDLPQQHAQVLDVHPARVAVAQHDIESKA